MLDYAIRAGTLIDGTGDDAVQADVGIRDGRVAAVGVVDEPASAEFDAAGLMVAPGIVDPHTHYDAQLFWDPVASPSNVHGVTTVIGGNCGFTLAPINAEDADYIRRMMAKVEGMPLAALEQGVPWTWSTFGQYLDSLEGRLGVNAGFLVGHCALRRKVMGGARGEEVATDEEISAMRALLAESIAAGGLGFSSSQSRTHSDGDGRLVSSFHADRREILAFCEEVGAHEGTTLEYITNGCLDSFSDAEIDLMTAMSVTARRPLNWNVLTVDAAGGRPHRAPVVRLFGRGRRRGPDRRADHAHPRADEHELPHPLRPLPDPGLGRGDGPARGRAAGQTVRPGGPLHARRACPQQGGGRLPRPVPLGHLCDRRHLRSRQ